MNRILAGVFGVLVVAATAAHAAPPPLDRPSALEADVNFWRRVYT
jgi:hypothetical protein